MTYTQKFPIQFDPIADPDAVVTAPKARFTMLTSRLLRLEFSPDDRFEDRPSQAFWYRRQPVPEFKHTVEDDQLEIETGRLRLQYTINPNGFTDRTLKIQVKSTGAEWRYGQDDPHNLLGTARTLDDADGPIILEQGLLSPSGWAVYDDSQRLIFNDQGWLEQRDCAPGYRDLYFFGCGYDYAQCLADFFKIAGPVPMPPRWAFGNWWSRYWEYSDQELLALMDDFKNHQVPLAVCIVDMDWHITDTGNACSGWTGYTWNRALFPDPPAFLAQLHERGLRTALNLHPAEGVHAHEAAYPALAERMGIDPAAEEPIAFDIVDPTYARAYFELLHHPLEEQGVDFWWLDWQQGTLSKLPGLDPLWWINHLHYFDLARTGEKRPFIFSRWGGLGNHRYPIGFSGDTHITWDSLAFQPYFTATAANVGYSWWSHDIGGHMGGVEDAELFTRWVQFGVFSPILRLHSTKNRFHDRRPWGFDAQTEALTRTAMQLRHRLIPYLYSLAWRNHTRAEAPIRPMYHDHPTEEAAYLCPDQYTFGKDFIVAPYITPQDHDTRLSRQMVWLPGDPHASTVWYDFFSGLRYSAGAWHALYGSLAEIPFFARAGAIIPLAPAVAWGGVDNPRQLEIHLFPGADNRFDLFEDGGQSLPTADTSSITSIHQTWTSERWQVAIEPVVGVHTHLPAVRAYTLFLRDLQPGVQIEVQVDGRTLESETRTAPDAPGCLLGPFDLTPEQRLQVTVLEPAGALFNQDYRLPTCRKMLHAFRLNTYVKDALDNQLPELLEQPQFLAPYTLRLSDSQTQALLEVVCQSGLHTTPLRGQSGQVSYMWNNDGRSDTSYRLIAHDANRMLRQLHGPVPRQAALYQAPNMLRFSQGTDQSRRFHHVSDWFDILPGMLRQTRAADLSAVLQFEISGPDGLSAYIHFQNGRGALKTGKHSRPNASLSASQDDWLALVNGDETAYDLYTAGKLQISGKPELLIQFQDFLSILPKDQFSPRPWSLSLDYLGIYQVEIGEA